MLATEHVETARQFLADADREYEAGDILQASEKLRGAASHVVIAEMQRRGMKASAHRDMMMAVRQFSEDCQDDSLSSLFYSARYFYHNSNHGFMEDYEFEIDRDMVHRFVERMMILPS